MAPDQRMRIRPVSLPDGNTPHRRRRFAVHRSRLVSHDPEARVALFVHGLGSHRRGEKASYFAAKFNAQGWAYAAVDLRGHGEADGSIRDLTLSGLLTDLRAAMNWLATRDVASPPILIGSSMGGAVIAWYALEHAGEVGPLVMIAPSLSFPAGIANQIGPDALHEWRQTGARRWQSEWLDMEVGYGLMQDADHYDPSRLQEELDSPIFIVHGMRDATIDWRASIAFAEGCRSPCDVLLLKDGDHRLTEYKAFLFDAMWAWLLALVKPHAAS